MIYANELFGKMKKNNSESENKVTELSKLFLKLVSYKMGGHIWDIVLPAEFTFTEVENYLKTIINGDFTITKVQEIPYLHKAFENYKADVNNRKKKVRAEMNATRQFFAFPPINCPFKDGPVLEYKVAGNKVYIGINKQLSYYTNYGNQDIASDGLNNVEEWLANQL